MDSETEVGGCHVPCSLYSESTHQRLESAAGIDFVGNCFLYECTITEGIVLAVSVGIVVGEGIEDIKELVKGCGSFQSEVVEPVFSDKKSFVAGNGGRSCETVDSSFICHEVLCSVIEHDCASVGHVLVIVGDIEDLTVLCEVGPDFP